MITEMASFAAPQPVARL